MSDLSGQKSYEFGDFCLIPREGQLLQNGVTVPLTVKAFETLLFLVEHRGHLVQKTEIMDAVWADSFVEENAVSKTVWSIRQALGEDPKHPDFIETVPKRGYRFVAEVREIIDGVSHPESVDKRSEANDGLGFSPPKPARREFRPIAVAVITLAAILLGVSALALRGGFFSSSGNIEIRSMTVLPFENLSGDPAEDYFVDGVTDVLIADLSRIKTLQVIALPADLRQKSGSRDLHEIGQKLGVDGLLLGSVSHSGDHVRISIQLIHVSNGRNLWSNSYEKDSRDVQGLHREIARNVAEAVRHTLTPQETESLENNRRVADEAYDEFLHGRYFLNLQNPKDQDSGIAALERAVQIDPSFGDAWAELAQAYIWKQFAFAPKEKDLTEKAYAAVQKSFALNSESGAAYLARGRLLWTPKEKFPHDKAISDYRQAIDRDPSLAEARNQLALVYCHVGLLDEALAQAREGVRLDPTRRLLRLRIGQTLNSQMKFDEALPVLNSIPAETHPSVIGHQIAWALFNLGRVDEALQKTEEFEKQYPDEGGTFAAMKAVIRASQGNTGAAEKLIAQAIKNGEGYGHFHHTAYTIACAYALMNKQDEAIKWLESTADTGFPCYPSFEKDPNLNNLRRNPVFQAFLSKEKIRWETFKAM